MGGIVESPGRRAARRGAERIVPAVRLVRTYRREFLGGDLAAGLAVCVLSIPMAIACSGLVGVDPERGLAAAVVGLAVYALLTRSRSVVVGPDTSVAIVVAAALANVAAGDAGRIASLAALVAILAGAIMIMMAAARVGAVADFLSRPVLVGFMNGAALIVIFSQLGKLLGLSLQSRAFPDVLLEVKDRLGEVPWGSAGVSVGLVAAVLAGSRAFPRLPWSVVVFLVGIVASAALDLEGRGFAVVGAIPRSFPAPEIPDVALSDVTALLPAALGVAFLTFPEAILLARAFGGNRPDELEPNRELLALGVANVMSGVLLGFSIAASSTRTSVSRAVGGRTQLAHLFAAVFLAVSLLFLSPVIAKLPVVAIAAILVYAGARLIDLATVVALFRASWKSGMIAVLTTVGVLIVGIVPGILAGVLMSLILVVHDVSRPPDAVLRRVEGRKGMHDVADEDEGGVVPGLVAYRFYAPLIFSNARWFCERVRSLVAAAEPATRCVLLDAQAVSDLDVTAAEQLRALILELAEHEVRFMVANANRPLREKLERYHLTDLVGRHELNRSVNSALKEFLAPAANAS